MAEETWERLITINTDEGVKNGGAEHWFKGTLDGQEKPSTYRFPVDECAGVSVGGHIKVYGHSSPYSFKKGNDTINTHALMVDTWKQVEDTPAPQPPAPTHIADTGKKVQGEFRTPKQIMRGQACEIVARWLPGLEEKSFTDQARRVYFLIRDGFGMSPEDVAIEMEGEVDRDDIPF